MKSALKIYSRLSCVLISFLKQLRNSFRSEEKENWTDSTEEGKGEEEISRVAFSISREEIDGFESMSRGTIAGKEGRRILFATEGRNNWPNAFLLRYRLNERSDDVLRWITAWRRLRKKVRHVWPARQLE